MYHKLWRAAPENRVVQIFEGPIISTPVSNDFRQFVNQTSQYNFVEFEKSNVACPVIAVICTDKILAGRTTHTHTRRRNIRQG